MLWKYGTNAVEVWHQCCGFMAPIMWMYGTNAVEVCNLCSSGMAPMLVIYENFISIENI